MIHANNVLAHVADLDDFVAGVRLLLKPDGLAVIEVPYVVDMVERVEFDTISCCCSPGTSPTRYSGSRAST